MSKISAVRIVPDDTYPGGARADRALLVPAQVDVLFQGFNLAGQTAYAAVVSDSGRTLTTPAPLILYDAGSCGRATLDCDDELMRSWLEDEGADRARVALCTEADGWLAFASVVMHRLPELPSM